MSKSKIVIGDKPITDAKSLGYGKILILGIQHLFAMFGATILVPIITGLSIQVTLLCAGAGTLFFHLCGKFKVPAFLGSSFAFLGGFAAVKALDTGVFAGLTEAEKLPYACGGIIVAGLLYLILAFVIKLVGVQKVMRYLPPVVTGPIIILIGVTLAPTAIANASTNWTLALIAILTIIICNIWGKGMIKITPILIGVGLSYAVALVMHFMGATNVDGSAIFAFEKVQEATIVGLPPFVLAKFDISAILIMAPIAIATVMEHIGDMSAISATCNKKYFNDPGLHRTLLGDGLATMFAAFIGGPANTTYGENTAVLALSKVHDPLVVRVAAYIAILLACIPKFSAIISTIPMAIIGGISFILYGMISAVGVRNVVENQVDFTNTRNLMIAALILVCGLGFPGGLTFTVFGTNITLTGLAIAALVGIILNAVLPGKDYEIGSNEQGDESVNFKV